eukprot:746560-Hanusia_phi.AAC.5
MDFDASEAIGTAGRESPGLTSLRSCAALSQSGATATVILHNSDSLLVASVGDSRAVLAGEFLLSTSAHEVETSALDGTSVALTTDHNPADPAERFGCPPKDVMCCVDGSHRGQRRHGIGDAREADGMMAPSGFCLPGGAERGSMRQGTSLPAGLASLLAPHLISSPLLPSPASQPSAGAFGDYLAKQAGVIAEPDLKCVKIGKNKVEQMQL